ncbi:MAG: YIP1 family protein [Pseudomonadota bacterium]
MAEQQSGAAARRGVMDRIWASWRAPRREFAALLAARPGEATLLTFLMIAGLFGFMSRFADHAATPLSLSDPVFIAEWEQRYTDDTGRDPADLSDAQKRAALTQAMDDKLTSERLGMMIGSFIIFPLGVYLLASLAAPVLRWAGGEGGGYGTRAAMAWAAVCVAPIGFAAQLALIMASAPPTAETIAGVVLGALWLWFLATFLAEAHGFRSGVKILGVVLAALLATVGAVQIFG